MQAPASPQTSPTACAIIIGNEVLSGRTQDKNLSFMAKLLGKYGIIMTEARVIPDIPKTIIDTVNACREQFTYVFTTGGIGPTHDDITAQCIADAFQNPLERNPDALKLLEAHYDKDQLNNARLKMANIPKGATLVPNPVSAAPGFNIENVYVLAGVPRIMQAMMEHIAPTLAGGAAVQSKTLSCFITEGQIAKELGEIQNQYPAIDIGSYPFFKQQKLGTSLVMRGTDTAALDACTNAVRDMLKTHTNDIFEGELNDN